MPGRCRSSSKQSISVVSKDTPVDLLGMVELLHRHVTESLCDKVFRENRTVERQREWSLHALAWFWMAVMIRAPKALTRELDRARRGQDRLLPPVDATPEAFFQKSKGLHWRFFAELFNALGERMLPETRLAYAKQVEGLREHFPEIWVMDGSQLAAVARRLKILWKVRAAVLPGRIFVFYDLFRGVCRVLNFDPDAAKNENLLAKEALELVPEGTLLLGDRLFGHSGYFEELSRRKLWGVFRRHGMAKVRRLKVLGRKHRGREFIDDTLVQVGCGANGKEKQTLRLIRYRSKKRRLEVFTNVLDPKKLPAHKIVELYGLRWSVERMFFDLKVVLNLNCFYAANPNAIAMQVYAAAIVYNTFRIMQARIAQQHGIPAETISTARLYPKLAVASAGVAECELMWQQTLQANAGTKLNKPSYAAFSFAATTLGAILAEKKTRPRTKGRGRPPCTWLSWRKVRGGQKLMAQLS